MQNGENTQRASEVNLNENGSIADKLLIPLSKWIVIYNETMKYGIGTIVDKDSDKYRKETKFYDDFLLESINFREVLIKGIMERNANPNVRLENTEAPYEYAVFLEIFDKDYEIYTVDKVWDLEKENVNCFHLVRWIFHKFVCRGRPEENISFEEFRNLSRAPSGTFASIMTEKCADIDQGKLEKVKRFMALLSDGESFDVALHALQE